MPTPTADTASDAALWTRAEKFAHELLDFHDNAAVTALDDTRSHQQYFAKGEAAEHELFERLFKEAHTDRETVDLLLQRTWAVLNNWTWSKGPQRQDA